MSDDAVADERRSILVAFGLLTNEQRALIDAHPLRGPGAFIPTIAGALLATFLVRPDSDVEAAYDEIHQWALENAIPIHQLIDDAHDHPPQDDPS